MLESSLQSGHGQQEEQTTIVRATERSADVGQLLDLVQASLDDDKAEELVTVDLHGKSSIADYMVIANGRSDRHVGALADHLMRKVKDAGHGNCKVEGVPKCDWVLIDIGDVIVHLFRPEVRDFYNLEKLWSVEMNDGESIAV
jgi:ribosome-associated protein